MSVKLYINEHHKTGYINPEIYGHFSEHLGRCIYEGLYVGKDSDIPNENGMRCDVVNALKEIRVPVLRWPGGCFADEYHWKDGTGPESERGLSINNNWGGVTEPNTFGTHEYFELCRQLGCKTYVNGNVGSGSIREMSEWIEYMTSSGSSRMTELRKKNGREEPWKLDYFGVGNECWGGGGNMTPEFYADNYRRYQTYIRNYDQENPVYKICVGANAADYDWTDRVMKECFRSPAVPEAHGYMDGLSVHYYTVADEWTKKKRATDFDTDGWYRAVSRAAFMEELIKHHGAVMDKYDPDGKIGMIIDEWGCWHDVEEGTNPGFLYQQNTMRDAVVAAVTLNIFNKYCRNVRMACIAQMVNVLQSVILTDGDQMLLTPTYHVYHMFRNHQGAQLLDSFTDGSRKSGPDGSKVNDIYESVSLGSDGMINITIANTSPDSSNEIEISFHDLVPDEVSGTVLHDEMHAHNTFEEKDKVTEKNYAGIEREGRTIRIIVPACSVTALRVRGKA